MAAQPPVMPGLNFHFFPSQFRDDPSQDNVILYLVIFIKAYLLFIIRMVKLLVVVWY